MLLIDGIFRFLHRNRLRSYRGRTRKGQHQRLHELGKISTWRGLEPLEFRILLSTDTALIGLDQFLATLPPLTGEGHTAVIIDDGINQNHSVLAANIWTNPDETPDNGTTNGTFDQKTVTGTVNGYTKGVPR